MPDSFNVGSSTAVAVPAETDDRKTIFNASGSTLHYDAASDVSTSDASLVVGASVSIEAINWIISAGSSNVIVTEAADDLSLDDLSADVITPSSITPVTTPTGIANWVPPTATSGTDTAFANGTQFLTSVYLPYTKTLTGFNYLLGSVGGTDKVYVVLYSSAGAVLANSSLTSGGATAGTAAETQAVAFTATYSAVGPARYFVGVSANGNTAKLRTIPAFTSGGVLAGSVSQTHGTVAAVTVPATFTADKAPVGFIY